MKLSLFVTAIAALFSANLHGDQQSIYLAGPLFTLAERNFNKELATQLRALNYKVLLPQEEEPRDFTAKDIFEMDRNGIDRSSIVVAIFDGPDPDSGTCWECGYACAKGKPVVAVRTDFRNVSDGGLAPYNLMLSESASKWVHLSSLECGMEKVVSEIDQRLKELSLEKQP